MAITRRSALMGAGAAGALVAVPAIQHLRWGAKDFVRDGYDPDMLDPTGSEDSWMNWAGNQKSTPTSIFWPETEADLADRVRDTQTGIRPVGSGHSFSGVAPSEGMMVNVGGLEGLRSFDEATGEATFGAGTLLFNAAQALDAKGRAFENLSDIDVQTLAGAFSTATHGTGQELTALHDYITGFRLVTPSGDIVEVSQETNAELFAAGKASLGALGVITEYRLRTVPAFNLDRTVIVRQADDFLADINDLADTHRHFEFYYFPGTRLVATIAHDKTDVPVSEDVPTDDDEILHGLKLLRDQLGWWPWLRRRTAQSEFPSGVIEQRIGKSFDLLATARPIQFVEMEYHLPREEGPATVAQVMKMLDHRKEVYFPMEYRHVASDDAWLSPFNGGPRASIAIHSSPEENYDYFFSEFEPLYLSKGGRPHWGKLHSLDGAALAGLYPQFDQFNELRRDLDPTGKFLNPHLAKIFGDADNA